MTSTSVSTPPKLHLFNLAIPLLASVIESLQFMEIVRLVDFIMLPNASGRHLWHTQIKSLLRSHFLKCPYMNNRRYGFKSIKWLLDREMTIRNFTTRELNGGMTQLHYACTLNKIWLVQACIAFNNKDDMTKMKMKMMRPSSFPPIVN